MSDHAGARPPPIKKNTIRDPSRRHGTQRTFSPKDYYRFHRHRPLFWWCLFLTDLRWGNAVFAAKKPSRSPVCTGAILMAGQ
jgi:hypothetical protein